MIVPHDNNGHSGVVALLCELLFLCVFQVYDIAFSRAGGGRDMFASVGADGSVRMFDLR